MFKGLVSAWASKEVCDQNGVCAAPNCAADATNSACFVDPGSGAWIHHAETKASYCVKAPCSEVVKEIQQRVHGDDGWFDQHNRGTYSCAGDKDAAGYCTLENVDGFPAVMRLQRRTGAPKLGQYYTDKIDLNFIDQTNKSADDKPNQCTVDAFSASQSTSYLDFSTNYCNSKMLLCQKEDGCNTVGAPLEMCGETVVDANSGQSSFSDCKVLPPSWKSQVDEVVPTRKNVLQDVAAPVEEEGEQDTLIE